MNSPATFRGAGELGLPTWPSDKPFPLTDQKCAALIRGDLVRWRGTVEDMFALPGRYELIEGWLMLKRSA